MNAPLSGSDTRFVLVAGSTETARIDGISAAGADPDLAMHTPSADAEILAYGDVASAPVVPVSPTGCPTPAAMTRAVREHLGFPVTILDAGMAQETTAPTVDLDAVPGNDVREPTAVPTAAAIASRARAFARDLPAEELVVAETIPGGTTTALGVLHALGVDTTVSSSLPENPLALKRDVVAAGLDASDLTPGACSDEPLRAVETMGDPVLAAVFGLLQGAADAGTPVTLAGGTQLVAASALARHGGVDQPLSLSTTSFVAADPSTDLESAASALDLTLSATDPAFPADEHPAMDAFLAGEAKEGVGMGGALALARSAGIEMPEIRDRFCTVVDRLLADTSR